MFTMHRLLHIGFTLSLLVLSPIANAEKADQDKPIILEAEKVSVNDVQQVYDLKGQVLLIKGSIIVTGEDGHIQVDPEGYELVDVKGSADTTASFRQRREGPADEFIQGRGAQVTYNAKTEILTITGDASLKRSLNMQMLDQLQGWKIEYDDIKERYRVTPPANAKAEDLPLARAILSPRRKATLEK
jgi:lipopolysaccharide export system protein LptA